MMWFIPFKRKKRRLLLFFFFFHFYVIDLRSFFRKWNGLKIVIIVDEMNIADFCVNAFFFAFSYSFPSFAMASSTSSSAIGTTEKRLKCSICRCGRKITSQTLSSQFLQSCYHASKKKLYQCLLIPSTDSIIRLMRLTHSNARHFYEHWNWQTLEEFIVFVSYCGIWVSEKNGKNLKHSNHIIFNDGFNSMRLIFHHYNLFFLIFFLFLDFLEFS